MGITYKEKIKRSEGSFAKIENGESIDDLRQSLKSEGLSNSDIDKVLSSAKRLFREKYLNLSKEYLLDGTLNKQNEKLTHLNDQLIDLLVEECTQKIKRDKRKIVNFLIAAQKSDNEILNATVDNFYTKHNALEDIEKIESSLSLEVKSESNSKIIAGLGILIVGVGLTILFLIFPIGNKSILFYGLIIYGLYSLVTGMTLSIPERNRIT